MLSRLFNLFEKERPTKMESLTQIINATYRIPAQKASYTSSRIRLVIEIMQRNELLSRIFLSTIDPVQLMARHHADINSSNHATSINLKPFTSTCLSCNQLLVPSFLKEITVFNQMTIGRACIYKTCCSYCRRTYYPMHYDQINHQRNFTTPEAMLNNEYIYFGGNVGYSNDLFIQFTSLLLHSHMNFKSFCKAYNGSVEAKKKCSYSIKLPTMGKTLNLESKLFQMHWIQFQVAQFVFMTTKDFRFEILETFENTTKIEKYLEEFNPMLYQLFVVLWTNHKSVSLKCEKNCSQCLLTDGHEKPSRLLCAHDTTCTIQHEELSPLRVGCPRTPMRRRQGNQKEHIEKEESRGLTIKVKITYTV
ncbi:unnamed protein product [Didymodactylos carnosus]|uniref:Uncharacterized protein n=1 Tax=Didymodactylos carnosus TaxID=1234261 RepID=A0A815EQZ9_9BILA|nr:unnamed protein product [Didymodactylos carnosus]CAF1314886.1 unnamed protein product [Didymodactylos carnosus]CAF3928151.1 unnamed protein product [Didymodactylos carnosus]CAF4155695.1 unnamed protein product [Didymodactylos carnosus]